jgi:hypothetical protein
MNPCPCGFLGSTQRTCRCSPDQVARMLLDETADMGLATESLSQYPELVTLPCYEWQHVMVVPRDHPLASVERIHLEQIAAEPLVSYHPSFTGRTRVDKAFAARHLTPGGRFVIELGVPPLRFLPPGQVAVPFDVSERHLGFDTFDLVEQVLVSHHLTRDGDDGRYRRDNSRHRYAWPAELDLMARIAGLELERRVADWDENPFTQGSAKHISVWRKPT